MTKKLRSKLAAAPVAVLALACAAPAHAEPAPTTQRSTPFKLSVKDRYDAWGKVVWLNRSIKIQGTLRNWGKGCRMLELRTTRAGTKYSGTTCRRAEPLRFSVTIDGSRLRGGIRGVGITAGRQQVLTAPVTFDRKHTKWVERPAS